MAAGRGSTGRCWCKPWHLLWCAICSAAGQLERISCTYISAKALLLLSFCYQHIFLCAVQACVLLPAGAAAAGRQVGAPAPAAGQCPQQCSGTLCAPSHSPASLSHASLLPVPALGSGQASCTLHRPGLEGSAARGLHILLPHSPAAGGRRQEGMGRHSVVRPPAVLRQALHRHQGTAWGGAGDYQTATTKAGWRRRGFLAGAAAMIGCCPAAAAARRPAAGAAALQP